MSERTLPLGTRLGQILGADFAPTVRHNMHTELWGSLAYGVFYGAAIQFIYVVLRRLGASADVLALYTSLTYLGFILTSFSIVLMRRRRTKTFAVVCWMAARGLFLVFAFVENVYWLLVVLAMFWILEAFPSPAYTRIIQVIYPEKVRGHAMSVVRFGMVGTILLITPIAGWTLDNFSYRLLFPLAALAGLLSTWFFNRLDVDEGVLPPRQTRTLTSLWSIIRSNRNFAFHLLAFTVYGLGALIGFPYYAIIQVDHLDLSYTQIGLLGFAQSIAWLLGFIGWGRALDRRGGLWVLRINLLVGFFVPFPYIFAALLSPDVGAIGGLLLLPAFIAQGIISAGVDLGLLNTCIQLAEPDRVVEYAAIQATVVGLRGLVAPFIGVALVGLGAEPVALFVVGCITILLSWVILGNVQIPLTPEQMREKRRQLRFRWPIRFRFPRM